jgi:hypothetical protein
MKRLLFFTMLIAWFGGALPAQNLNLDAQMRAMLAPLDKSGLQTGILLQQAPMFVHPFRYDGVSLNDSNLLDASNFGRLYGLLRAAAIGPSGLPPSKESYRQEVKRLRGAGGDTIPLALMFMQYEYIRPDALASGLLYWDNGIKAFQDVQGRSTEPYLRDTMFAFAALLPEAKGRQVVFQLPTDRVFQNVGWAAGGIEMDFDDGAGWRPVQAGGCVSVQYPNAGPKNLRIRTMLQGRQWLAHSRISVPQSAVAERFSDKPDEIVHLSGDSLSIFFHCEDRILRKPLIVVEGFGGDITKYTQMLDLLSEFATGANQNLKDWLDAEGYDLVWVDWLNSNASIQDNAATLRYTLEYINERKHASGSIEPNVVIGASMGGLVAKYCLLYMHNILGRDSEVERLFTYDSPLKGANFPVGIQLLIRDFVRISEVFEADISDIEAALYLLDGPAASQMLRQKAVINLDGTLGLSSAGFDALQTEIAALEAIQPLTGITRHIAISNGAGNGVGQESIIPDGSALLATLTIDNLLFTAQGYSQAFVAGPNNTKLYARDFETFGGGVLPVPPPISLGYVEYVHPAPLSLDVMPGGNSDIALNEVKVGLLNALESVSIGIWNPSANVALGINHFGFVSTVSGLDLPIGTSPTTGNLNNLSPASRSSFSMDNAQISSFSSTGEYNQEHVSMNTRIADLLVNELTPVVIGGLSMSLSDGQTYNYGRSKSASVSNGFVSTPSTLNQSLSIPNGAQLWINRSGKIGYTDNLNNPQNFEPQRFWVGVPGEDCAGMLSATVTVQEGGHLRVGQHDVGNIGDLVFGANSHLIVNGSQGVEVDKYSSLYVQNGATATINAGGEVLVTEQGQVVVSSGGILRIKTRGTFRSSSKVLGAALVVKDGGTLILEPGSMVDINDPSVAADGSGAAAIKVEAGGKLRIEGEFAFTGNGYFWLQGACPGSPSPSPCGPYPIYEDLRPEVRWEGAGKGNRRLYLDNFPLSAINQPVRIQQMRLDCSGNGGITAEGADLRVLDARVQGTAQPCTAWACPPRAAPWSWPANRTSPTCTRASASSTWRRPPPACPSWRTATSAPAAWASTPPTASRPMSGAAISRIAVRRPSPWRASASWPP